METENPEVPNAPEAVNHPSHYTNGRFEVIEILEDQLTPEQFKGFLKGNILKYVMRSDHKGKPLQDCEKAEWYLAKLNNFFRKDVEK